MPSLMTTATSHSATVNVDSRQPILRLWPAVLLLAIQWMAVLIPKWAAPGTMAQFIGMFWGPIAGGILFLGWWLFFSRAAMRDRWLLMGACLLLGGIALAIAHSSIGLMGLSLYGLPTVTTAWAVWLLVAKTLSWPVRRAGLLLVFVLGWGYFTLLRLEGIDGSLVADLSFRWTPTAEEKFLAGVQKTSTTNAVATVGPQSTIATTSTLTADPEDWPEFRGPNRDNRLTGTHLDSDLKAHPPKQLWKHRIGPGWSSFSVVGTHLYTQEQRGEEEAVVCYDADSGKEQWSYQDKARFTEVVAGPGPRGTPTFHEGNLYSLGAAGRLNCLDASTGGKIWTKDIVADSDAKIPQWGFSASPLVVGDLVTVFAGGPKDKGILAYRRGTGELVWTAPSGLFSYCSLQRSRIADVDQLLINTDAGLSAYEPATGKKLWQHDWPLEGGMSRVVQPAVLSGSDILVGTSFGYGTQRVRVTHESGKWKTEALWTSRAIKPYFNDLVVQGDSLYGFDGNIFTCVNLADEGKNRWRARGYGNGQVLLLADQKLLLILTEQGEVALVAASPESHQELARFPAIEGKTWNHPVLVRDRLFVRNGEEVACYQMPQLPGKRSGDNP